MRYTPVKEYFIGDDCLCWSLGDSLDPLISRKVLYLYRRLLSEGRRDIAGIRDVVPAYKGVSVYFDPAGENPRNLVDRLRQLVIDSLARYDEGQTPIGKSLTIPVVYDGEDLEKVALSHGLTIPQVIRKHTKPRYLVAMIGFRPHFPYLLGLDPHLATPRLDRPRISVRAGSIGIGGAQTGIYPEDSPGGWNIIGHTRAELTRDIDPGDTIIFEEVRGA